MINRLQNFFIFYFILLICGCTEETNHQEVVLAEHINSLENLTVYSADTTAPDTVELVKETVFESNDEVFIEGNIGDIAVDDQDRVYIVGSVPGNIGIYVFEADGSFVTKFMREGRGPGETEAVGSMKISNGEIYVLGPRLQKFAVFSLDDFSLVHDAILKKDSVADKKFSLLRATELYVDEQERLFMEFRNNMLSDTLGQIYYYRISETGQIAPEEIFKQRKYTVYPYAMKLQGGTVSSVKMPWSMPFNRGSLFSISSKGKMYDLWTEDYLIKIYDSDGNYLRAIYYPYQKSILDTEKLDIPEDRKEAFEDEAVPSTWPAVHKMMVDEEERIWIAAITDSDSTYQWFVLENNGALKARFTFPGKRSERNPMFKRQLPIVKNGSFYTQERDIRKGIDRIVKYKIVFRKR